MNSLLGLSPATLRKAADLQEKILELQKEVDQLLGQSGSTQAPVTGAVEGSRRGQGRQSTRAATRMTTNQAILKALEPGQLDVPTITAKVLELKGKASKAAIYQGLVQLKKTRKISNPARGQYLLK